MANSKSGLVARVDSSTQSCKVVVREIATGRLVRSGRAAHPDGTEVHPDAWWSALQTAIEDPEARISRFQAAVAAGVEPVAMIEAINEAQAERAAARAELDNTSDSETVTDAEIYAMIDSLGDVGAALSGAKHDRLAALYKAVDLQVRYEAAENAAEIEIRLASRVNSVRVRGASCTLTTRFHLPDRA